MSPRPLVTFVVINWRAEEATIRCLETIRAQAGLSSAEMEIRVVDNASTAESQRALAASDVTVIASRRNTGFAGGANLGIDGARGRYVAVVNNDAVLDPDWASLGLDLMERELDVGLVGGADLAWSDGTAPGSRDARAVTAPRIDPDGGFAETCDAPRPHGDVLALNGSNLLARGDLLRRLRGFDPAFFAYYEDTDLSARVWATGHRVVFVPGMVIWHRRSMSSDRIPFRKCYLAYRNHLRVVAKHFPAAAWRPAVRRAALHNLVSGATGRIADSTAPVSGARRRAHLAAGLWGLVNAPTLARARRDAVARGEHYAGFVDHARRDAAALAGAAP